MSAYKSENSYNFSFAGGKKGWKVIVILEHKILNYNHITFLWSFAIP